MSLGRCKILVRMVCGRFNVRLFVVFGALLQGVLGGERKDQSTGSKMTVGMIAGFGFVAGVAAIFITVWCCCCGNGCKSDLLKVVPMDIQEPETRSTSAGSKGAETSRLERNESTESN